MVCTYGLQLQKLAGLAAALDGRAAFMIERSKVLYMGLETKAIWFTLTLPVRQPSVASETCRRKYLSHEHDYIVRARCPFFLGVSSNADLQSDEASDSYLPMLACTLLQVRC